MTTFIDHWTIPSGISDYALMENETKFIGKLFKSLCAFLEKKQLTTAGSHLQKSGQVERLNKTIIAQLRHCLAEHQQDQDIYVVLLTYT